MMIFLAGILAAAAANPPDVNTNEAVAREYHRILEHDDAAEQDILRWTDPANLPPGGGENARLEVQMRIRQRVDSVRHEYEDFLLRYPNYVNGHIAFGSFLNDVHEEDEAVAQWDTARLLAPTNPAPWNNLANYYGERGPIKKAFEYFQKAIDLDPGQSVYYHNLAMLIYVFRPDAEEYYHLNETQVFDKALVLYRKAVRLAPDNFIFYSDYAMSFYGTRPPRWQDGLEAWTGALKVTHDELERQGVYIHLARINIKLGHFDAARANLAAVNAPQYSSLKRKLTQNLDEAVRHDTAATPAR